MSDEKEQFLCKSLKEDLKNLERYIEEFSVFLPLPVYALNPSGLIVDVNQAGKKMTGYSESILIGQEFEFLFKNKELAGEFFKQTLKKGLVESQEMILLTEGNREVPVKVSSSIRKDEEGNTIGCFLAVSDITEIKKFQEKLEQKVKKRTEDLEEEKDKTRAILFSLTDGLIVFDNQKRITLINPEAERILEVREEGVVNKKIEQLIDFPNFKKLHHTFGKRLEWTGRQYELVLDKPLKRFFQVAVNPFVVGEESIGFIVILHDITREREIDRMKTEFVSITAHQLRTPLSSIKWILRMILDGDVGEISKEQTEFLEKGYQSNERMISLINDLLNVARIEEGRFLYRLDWQYLDKIIEEVINSLEKSAKMKKIKIVFKKLKKPLPRLKVDGEKIRLVIQNLLDNAIRYSSEGKKVTISVNCDKMTLKTMVIDAGVGIPQSQQERVFNKFFRADNVLKLDAEGSGLGLFICKNIIEAHGGKIWFESQEGQGTTFCFTLPIKKS